MKNTRVDFDGKCFYFAQNDIQVITSIKEDYIYCDTFVLWKPSKAGNIPHGKTFEKIENIIAFKSKEEFLKFKEKNPVKSAYEI